MTPADSQAAPIPNTDDYVRLMAERARGNLPDMGCAIRVADLIDDVHARQLPGLAALELLDVGCATGHFLRTFLRRNMRLARYTGLEIDAAMVAAASEVWRESITAGDAEFINADLEHFSASRTFDVVICVNAFMYFASAKTALTNLMKATKHRLLVRSYFTDSNYRIMRAQTTRNHDKSTLEEIDAFDDAGNLRCYDFWNIYSFSYIEDLIRLLEPRATLEWIDDGNILSSMSQERELNIAKRGATEVLAGHEVSYPFILPWKYLSITMNR